MNRIQQAETLFVTRTGGSSSQENVQKASKIYKELCLNVHLTNDVKLEALFSFIKYVPDEGLDMLARWRDMLAFVRGDELNKLVDILVSVAKSSSVHSHERIFTAVTLYNRSFLIECFQCFECIACDVSALVDHRVEACRFLFSTEVEEKKELAQECLTSILETDAYPSDYRYKIIAGYISKTGIATTLNVKKIRVPYDESFVFGLQTVFFYNSSNNPRDRILSGQHMLDMTCVSTDEKREIADVLLEIARTKTFEDNLRADAADVVLRLGIGDQVSAARDVITELGYSTADTSSSSLMDRVKTIYTNKQNVHDEKVTECVEKFIERIAKAGNETAKIRPYNEVHQEVSDLVRSFHLEPSKRFAAFKALNRVSVDTATFSKYKVTIAELFIHVWLCICVRTGDERKGLEMLLVDELVDMGDTCSSGHVARFVNVIASVDSSLRISFEAQIIANITGRINARVTKLEDTDLRAAISMGMMTDPEEEDAAALIKFIDDTKGPLKKELHAEFVTAGFVNVKDFDRFFEAGMEQWKPVYKKSSEK